MPVLLSIGLVAAVAAIVAVAWAVLRVAEVLREIRIDVRRQRAVQLLTVFAPGMASAAHDVRALLSWHPVAAAARTLLPEDFAALDRATGKTFPFSQELIEQAHARWTADWLEWEQAHTNAYRLKVAQAEAEVAAGSPTGRARLDAVEREKLEMYQARYSQYVQVGKAIQALMASRQPPTT